MAYRPQVRDAISILFIQCLQIGGTFIIYEDFNMDMLSYPKYVRPVPPIVKDDARLHTLYFQLDECECVAEYKLSMRIPSELAWKEYDAVASEYDAAIKAFRIAYNKDWYIKFGYSDRNVFQIVLEGWYSRWEKKVFNQNNKSLKGKQSCQTALSGQTAQRVA